MKIVNIYVKYKKMLKCVKIAQIGSYVLNTWAIKRIASTFVPNHDDISIKYNVIKYKYIKLIMQLMQLYT